MKNVKISIRPADIASIKYNNKFTVKAGTPLKLAIKNGIAVKLNTSAPTNAIVIVRFEAKAEDESIVMEIETLTAVSSSTYIDDFEDVIKKQYAGVIMLNVNEKIKAIASAAGININIPAVTLPYGEQDGDAATDSLDDIINFNGKN